MSLDRIFNIAGSALNAQTTRMNTTASNLANAGTVTGKENEAFRAKRTVFKTIMEGQQKAHEQGYAGVALLMSLLLAFHDGFEHSAFSAERFVLFASDGARVGQVRSGGVHAGGLCIERRASDVEDAIK